MNTDQKPSQKQTKETKPGVPNIGWEFEKDAPTVRREILRKLLPRMAAMRICRAGGQDGGLDACDQSAPTGTAATQAGAAPSSEA